MQITNAMMVSIVYYVNGTFFVHYEMNNGHIFFSNLVFVGSFLSFALFVAFVAFDIKLYEKIFPYDSVPIFMALVGSWVTTVPFLL